MVRLAFVTAAAVLGLAACDLGPGDDMTFEEQAGVAPGSTPPSPSTAPTPAAATATPLTPVGPPVGLRPSTDANLQSAASVVQLDELANQNAKLFAVAGGDPVMNGLQTYIAFFHSPAEGWRVFQLGDFLEYKVLAITSGRIDLEITESVMNPTPNGIISVTRRAIVAFTPGAEGAPPTIVTLTTAR